MTSRIAICSVTFELRCDLLLLRVFCIIAAVVATGGAHAFDCAEKYCTKMSSCAEAHHHFTVCGEAERDADSDGIPCENVCGQTLEEYGQRRGGGSSGPTAPPGDAAPPTVDGDGPQQQAPDINEHGIQPRAAEPPKLSCAGKRKCGQMDTCEEARFYLSSCGVRSLDRDGDGVPCESLCGGL